MRQRSYAVPTREMHTEGQSCCCQGGACVASQNPRMDGPWLEGTVWGLLVPLVPLPGMELQSPGHPWEWIFCWLAVTLLLTGERIACSASSTHGHPHHLTHHSHWFPALDWILYLPFCFLLTVHFLYFFVPVNKCVYAYTKKKLPRLKTMNSNVEGIFPVYSGALMLN